MVQQPAASARVTYKKRSQAKMVIRRMCRNKGAVAGFAVLLLLALLAVFAEVVSPYHYAQIDIFNSFQGFSWAHPLGTDELGRDVLSRMLYGGRYSLTVGFFAVAMSCGLGSIVGAIAGYFGGKVDNVIMRVLDIISSLPNLLMAVCIGAVLGSGFVNTIIALGVSGIPAFARILRSSMLSVSKEDYVEAATSINCSHFRIITRHVFPNAMSPLIVQATMGIANSIIIAASLSFIGLGVQPPIPEWGAMLSAGRGYIRDYPLLVIVPGVFIMITVLSMNLIGDALRDALDPKLKN